MAKVLGTSSEEYKPGQQIRKYRQQNNLTQNQLTDLADLNRANIVNYENGIKSKAGFKTLIKFSRTLRVSVDIFLGGDDSNGLESAISQLN